MEIGKDEWCRAEKDIAERDEVLRQGSFDTEVDGERRAFEAMTATMIEANRETIGSGVFVQYIKANPISHR